MKRSLLCYYVLMAVACVSCFEGEDLMQTYESYSQSQTLTLEASNVSMTSAQIKVELSNPKFDSQIDVFYSDQPDDDLVSNGEKQTFIVADADRIIATENQFTLSGLMPDTKYRYIAVYTDVSGKKLQTDERSFQTPGFEMISALRSQTYFTCSVYTSFNNMIPEAEPGYIYGDQSELTLENAIGNVAVAYDGGMYAGCYETVSDLMPDTEYYLKPYIKYKERIYYGDINSRITPKIEVNFINTGTQIISNQLITIYSTAKLLNFSSSYGYVLPELEYGMLVSDHQDVTYDNATRNVVEPNWLGHISYDMTDAIPSVTYYARAYVRWQEQIFLSEEVSFCIPKSELRGDVDSLFINGQMMRFVLVKAGSFMMGATDEQQAYARGDEYPAHEVTISKDFYISEIEITNGMINGEKDDMPARRSYSEANDFAWYVRQLTGISSVSLPTEAEWEYAARGGHLHPEQTLFAGSDDPDEVAWVIDDPLSYDHFGYELPKIHQGGQKKPNALGIYDMSGNTAEWVRDAYQYYYYENSPAGDPYCAHDEWEMAGEEDRTQQRVIRGGGARTEWCDLSLIDYRVSARRFINQGESGFGFRLVIRNN